MDGSVDGKESWRKERQNFYRPPPAASEYVIRGMDTRHKRLYTVPKGYDPACLHRLSAEITKA